MKGKSTAAFCLLAVFGVLCLPFKTAAIERDFGAGSLIIPMDKTYQPDDDGGILEAYGLVFSLLSHKDSSGNHDITVYWIINQDKTAINGIDLEIGVQSITELNGFGVGAVVKLYNHSGSTTALTFRASDNNRLKVSYLGAPFIIDEEDADKAKAVINLSIWTAVNVHEAQVPFAAPVYREMRGAPPRIALMNDSETKDGGGNAAILESYLRLAGICTDVYDIVTPLEIRDGILEANRYDFVWAPHCTLYGSYKNDVEAIILKVREFLESGKGLFAECASIECFEHSENGRFLTNHSFGHNGGTNDADDIIYNDVRSANSQIGDYIYEPTGGHLHNWRPLVFGDPYKLSPRPDKDPVNNPAVNIGNPSVYNETVTRFTIDTTGWDYYVGGYIDGDRNKGYVVYLGGHRYADCVAGIAVDPESNIHPLEFEFTNDITDEKFIFFVKYDSGFSTSVTFSKSDRIAAAGDPLEVDVSSVIFEKSKILNVILKNKGLDQINVDSLTLSWTGANGHLRLKIITDTKTDEEFFKGETESGTEYATEHFNIKALGNYDAGCTNNDDCSPKNIAAVRYVLNTVFNIQFQIASKEYIRSAPIVCHPYLYQGTFEYPSFVGHFRRYDVTRKSWQMSADWDTARGGIENANNGNFNGRKVYTAIFENGRWSKIAFDTSNMDKLRTPLNVTPNNKNDKDEIQVINRLRGKKFLNNSWVERSNKLGGIMHSAPVIVGTNNRTGNKIETVYVGDVYGMLHAIDPETGNEKWAYIPHNLLGKLKNDRTDPQAIQDFAAVDASATVKDIFFDHDNNPHSPSVWRTILVCPEGMGGHYIFALDVTNPDDPLVLWEITDIDSPGGGMGHSCRAALNRVKWPIRNQQGEITSYIAKWIVFTTSGYADIAEDHGGINIYAFDLITGEKLWHFSSEYTDSVNDIPGAVTLFDMNGDNFMDRIYIGDMNGRLWEINAVDGTNPNGKDGNQEIPLWNCGVGNPISVSPSIKAIHGNVILIFGTGGTNWTSDEKSYAVYAINAKVKKHEKTYAEGAATLIWKLDLGMGEKCWSSASIAAGHIYLATTFGAIESSNPGDNIPKAGQKTGNLYSLDMKTGNRIWTISDIGKTQGAIFVDRQHIYLSSIDNKIIQVGGEDFSAGRADNVVKTYWREL